MPATRKIPHEVQDQDLNQLRNLFSDNSQQTENVAAPEFEKPAIKQRQTVSPAVSNSARKQSENINQKTETENVNPNIITEEKHEVSDTTVGIRMTTARKREMKAYFIQHGTTMSQGVIDAFTLLRRLEEDGAVVYKDGILEMNNA